MSVAERPGGTQAPGTETNGMQGPLIPFCALCGRESEPQKNATRTAEEVLFGCLPGACMAATLCCTEYTEFTEIQDHHSWLGIL